LNGLSRLEYRGYDSAGKYQKRVCMYVCACILCVLLGFAIDGDNEDAVIIKQVGKVAALRKLVDEQPLDFEKPFISHCGMVMIHLCLIKRKKKTNYQTFRLILVGLLTVNLHKSILILNVLMLITNSLSYTMVSLPTIRKSSFF
jgi:hypothetical protein